MYMECSHKKGRGTWQTERLLLSPLVRKKGKKNIILNPPNLIVDHGMEGDAHAGNWHRQISLLGIASIELYAGARCSMLNLVISLKTLQ